MHRSGISYLVILVLSRPDRKLKYALESWTSCRSLRKSGYHLPHKWLPSVGRNLMYYQVNRAVKFTTPSLSWVVNNDYHIRTMPVNSRHFGVL